MKITSIIEINKAEFDKIAGGDCPVCFCVDTSDPLTDKYSTGWGFIRL